MLVVLLQKKCTFTCIGRLQSGHKQRMDNSKTCLYMAEIKGLYVVHMAVQSNSYIPMFAKVAIGHFCRKPQDIRSYPLWQVKVELNIGKNHRFI